MVSRSENRSRRRNRRSPHARHTPHTVGDAHGHGSARTFVLRTAWRQLIAVVALMLALCAAGWVLASTQEHAKAATGDSVTLQYGPDGYFSTLVEGALPVVEKDDETPSVRGDGWANTRRIMFGKQGNTGTYGGATVSGGYKTLAVGAVPSESGRSYNNATVPTNNSSASSTTSVVSNEALLWADNVVTARFAFDTSNPHRHSFDSATASYKSNLALVSDAVGSSNYSTFELSLLRAAQVEGVCAAAQSVACIATMEPASPPFAPSRNSYKVFPLSVGDTNKYLNHTYGGGYNSNLACPSTSCANSASGTWLRSPRWDYQSCVYSSAGTGTVGFGESDYSTVHGLRPAFRLSLSNLLLSALSSDQSQNASGDLRLTVVDPGGQLYTWSSSVSGAAGSRVLNLSGTSSLGADMGWKIVDPDTDMVLGSGRTSAGGNMALPEASMPDAAKDYDLYVWGQQDGDAVAGLTNRATVPVKTTIKGFGYSIEYELNGGTNHPSNPPSYDDDDLPLTLLPPTFAGHVFVGWYSDAGFTTAVTGIPTGSVGAKKFYARWLQAPNISNGSFEYRINVTDPAANVIVPATGRSTVSNATFGAAYSWFIEVSDDDGATWTQVQCSAVTQTPGGGGCGAGALADAFTGTSADDAARGPVLGTMTTGSHWVRLIPVTATEGWLRAFATGRSGTAVHQSATMITEVGDIPFAGLDGTPGVASTTGDVVGYRMFYGTTHLVKVGKVLASDDAAWGAVNTVGADFFREAFQGAAKLTDIGAASFSIDGITTVGDYFLAAVFRGAASLEDLPAGSFAPSSAFIVTTATNYMAQSFYDASLLASLPANSFDMQHVTGNVGNDFMAGTFAGGSAGTAPKLLRADVARVAASWKLNQTNLNKSNVFADTFRNVETAQGSLEESEAAQIALNPNSARNTFAGTRLCTSSVNFVNWGFPNVCSFTSFDFKIAVSAQDESSNKHVIVPTASVSIGTPYKWRISVSSDDGATWSVQDCTAKAIAFVGGTCDGTDTAAYAGTVLSNSAAQGPDLGVFAEGEYWIRLQPVVQSVGWLRAFGLNAAAGTIPMSTQLIEVGDIPFLGLKDPAASGPTQAGNAVGTRMFLYASNLTRTGRFLHQDDPAWASVADVGNDFVDSMFEGTALVDIAAGSFRLENLHRVGYSFMSSTFRQSALTVLPAGSFDISGMTSAGNGFMLYALATANGMNALPDGSFDTSNLVAVGESFLHGTFRNSNFAVLPAGSFAFGPGLTSVPWQFLYFTFYASKLESLPAGSFDMSAITGVGVGFFMSWTFADLQGPGLRYDDILRVSSSWNLSQAELDKQYVLWHTFQGNGRDAGRLLMDTVGQLRLQPGGVDTEMRDTFTGTQFCSDSPYYAQYGLSECEPPNALPYTGSWAVWWWVLTAAALVLGAPTLLVRGRMLGAFAVGHALNASRATGRHGRQNPDEMPDAGEMT
ncbi:InlB B-repeat-containing protein [Bifidobacterium psychraerophilum]|uniref:Cell wall/surface repeat protein n=1 Tax=Bifidobacterium psychraerophilum TaxID=218140 RepID=A0A087CCM6_9BIFI|nr:InlB B-repeat-containing protein [Bifidobacterium psychraerophilum]KFI81026.1 cell wall/surface repeat protein [Bifidobacterium psychraerophilum]PKA95375.1 putative repeat protein (TIGR02543 family) [Bifidobacterium psychraerophilum DSM 22366]